MWKNLNLNASLPAVEQNQAEFPAFTICAQAASEAYNNQRLSELGITSVREYNFHSKFIQDHFPGEVCPSVLPNFPDALSWTGNDTALTPQEVFLQATWELRHLVETVRKDHDPGSFNE